MINMRGPLLLLAAYLSCSSALVVDEDQDGIVKGWNRWSACTKTCGSGGTTRREQYCQHMNGGPLYRCHYMTKSCNAWDCENPFADIEYSECSATCGSGSKEIHTKDGRKWKKIYCATQSCDLAATLAAVGGKVDVVFMVDSNMYVGGINWDITKQFVVDVTNALDVSDDTSAVRVGVVSYSTFIENAVELGEYSSKADLQANIFAMPYQAGSSIAYDAIDSMRAMFSAHPREGATRMAVLVTNSKTTSKQRKYTVKAAAEARAAGINLFVIGIGDGVDEGELKDVASQPLSSYYRLLDNYNDLQTLTDVTAGRICGQDISVPRAHMEALISEGWTDWSACSATCHHGWQQRTRVCRSSDYYRGCGIRKASCGLIPCVDPFRGVEWTPCTSTCGGGVRERYANGTDGADGYQQMTCSAQSCNLASSRQPTDVVFGLAGSYQAGDLGFESNKQFAMDIVSGCDLSDDRLRFGVMSYGTDTDVAVPCGDYASKEELLNSIDEMSFAAGSCNPVGAIDEITNMFAQRGRTEARKVVFIFINGRSGGFPASDASEVMGTARQAGLEIYVIAIGSQVDQAMISAIVSAPVSEHVMSVATYRDLATYADTTIAQMTGGIIPAAPQDFSNLPYGGWGSWSACTQTCGYGRQTRYKFCHQKGTSEFFKCSTQTSSCNSIMCDDLFYGREWGECSQSCGRGGLRTREAANSIEGFQRIHCGMQSCQTVSMKENTDLIFAMGGSRTAGTEGWAISQQLVTDVVNGIELSENVKLGLMSFANSYEVAVPLGQYTTKKDFVEDVWDVDYPAGGASVVEAVSGIVDMIKLNGRDDARKIAFIIIDGKTTHADGLEGVLEQAKDLNIDLYVVGVGERANDSDIVQVAGGESNVLAAENFNLVPHFTDYMVDFATTSRIDILNRPIQAGGSNRNGKLFPPHGSEVSIPGSGWHEWKECNTTCGNSGKQQRYKYCNQSPNTFTKCFTSMATCNTIPCNDPYHGSKWSECSATCGGGVRARTSSDFETERITCHNQPCAPYNGNCNVDIVFVLDSSGSIGVYNWFVTKQFVIDVVLGMNANMNMTRIGVVVYSTTVCREIELGAYTTDTLEKAVWNIDYMADATFTASGLEKMREMFADHGRKDAAKIAILLTDGRSNIERNETIPEAEKAKAEDIDIYVVGVSNVDNAEVSGIASNPDSRYVIHVDSYSDLESITEQIINVTCEDVLPCTDPEWGPCNATECGAIGTQWRTRVCTKIDPTTRQTLSVREILDSRPCVRFCPPTTTPTTTTTTETTTQPTTTVTTTEPTTTETETTTEEPTTTVTETTTEEPTTTVTETTTEEPTTTVTETTTEEPTTTVTETTTEEPTTTVTETTTEEPTTTVTETTTEEPTTTVTETTTEEPTTTVTETTTESTTTSPTTKTTRGTPGPPGPVDCDKCDFTMGQVWQPDPQNCHLFYVCEPTTTQGEYIIHHMTCGALFWNQDIHTCVAEKPAGVVCYDGDIVTAKPDGPHDGGCPLFPVAGAQRLYQTLKNEVMVCPQRMVFKREEGLCGCYPKDIVIPVCTDDLLLHFPYDDHFNDVTCHHAIGIKFGAGVVSIVNDTERGRVAWFDGNARLEVAFLRTWFAENEVDQFTVSLWFKRETIQPGTVGLVNNGDCEEDPNFEVSAAASGVYSGVTTTTQTVTNKVQVVTNQWYHVAMVYNGATVTMYLDGQVKSESASGFLRNPDCPMYVGFRSLSGYYRGFIDEIKIYERALTAVEVAALAA